MLPLPQLFYQLYYYLFWDYLIWFYWKKNIKKHILSTKQINHIEAKDHACVLFSYEFKYNKKLKHFVCDIIDTFHSDFLLRNGPIGNNPSKVARYGEMHEVVYKLLECVAPGQFLSTVPILQWLYFRNAIYSLSRSME